MKFSEEYGHLRERVSVVRETGGARDSGRLHETGAGVSEHVLQCAWYDRLYAQEGMLTDDGRPVRVVSPGWWNRSEGPDFKGAQIEFGGKLRTGDVEIHFAHAAWKQHGHHLDERYDGVILHVVLQAEAPAERPATSQGRAIPTLLLSKYLEEDIRQLARRLSIDEYDYEPAAGPGRCAQLAAAYGGGRVEGLLNLAGEWRVLSKARTMRERMERTGVGQAVYEAFLTACGFSRYKYHFCAIARQLPYERIRQLGRQDALLAETALLQLGGLLPESLPEGTPSVPHFERLRVLRRDHLGGLRSLPLVWKRVGVRPNNYPERRLSAAARFVARTASEGLPETLDGIWRTDATPVARRRMFESLFPKPLGFWATHCTWTGKRLEKPSALLGAGRVRSIIGNVFVPAALALARMGRDRVTEEKIIEFFVALPQESDNRVLKDMVCRFFGPGKKPHLDFRAQQGLLQMYQDWCEPNPSCRKCCVSAMLEPEGGRTSEAGKPF